MMSLRFRLMRSSSGDRFLNLRYTNNFAARHAPTVRLRGAIVVSSIGPALLKKKTGGAMLRYANYAVLFSVVCVSADVSAASAYPDKAARVIVPFATGGGTDIMGRVFSERLTTSLGKSFVVENRPGGGAMIGAELVAKAPPDGYTLLLVRRLSSRYLRACTAAIRTMPRPISIRSLCWE
jgi:hypothetical protein